MTAPPRLGRLKRRREFLAAARGRKAGGSSLGLQARRRRPDESARGGHAPADVRLGFTCSKKVGNAVERNRARRRLKAAAAAVAPELAATGCDYVLIGRRATIDYPFERLLDDMRRAFRDVGRKL